MYNLLVSADADEWEGNDFVVPLSRCVREYTDTEITEKFGSLDKDAMAALQRLPCIFAYESDSAKPPKFGVITDIVNRKGNVRVRYRVIDVDPFLSADDLQALSFDLDIGGWEMNRTHWAVKDVNLPKELHTARHIVLPGWTASAARAVDITSHTFDVALSFPGEDRKLVETIAAELEGLLGPDSYFYDNNYISQLARPSLDGLLQEIYRKRAKLVVVFLSSNYQSKEWCGVEFRAIREIIKKRDNKRVMFVRVDDGEIEGVFETDGYVDARKYAPKQIAQFIQERVALLS